MGGSTEIDSTDIESNEATLIIRNRKHASFGDYGI